MHLKKLIMQNLFIVTVKIAKLMDLQELMISLLLELKEPFQNWNGDKIIIWSVLYPGIHGLL